jgi:hypothetical protein
MAAYAVTILFNSDPAGVVGDLRDAILTGSPAFDFSGWISTVQPFDVTGAAQLQGSSDPPALGYVTP